MWKIYPLVPSKNIQTETSCLSLYIFWGNERKYFSHISGLYFNFSFFFQSEGEPPVSFASLSEDPPPLTFEPVVAEVENEDDNKYIFQLKKECSQDQLDYCAGAKYKSGDHTMCKHCVSCFSIYFPFYRLFIFRHAYHFIKEFEWHVCNAVQKNQSEFL